MGSLIIDIAQMLCKPDMGAIYRNNRLVPAIIIAVCFWLFFSLLRPVSIDVLRDAFPEQPSKTAQDKQNSVSSRPRPPSKTISASTTTPIAAQHGSQPSHAGEGLSKDEVLLVMKTGGTSMWKRLLIHLSTTLSSERIKQQNTVIYSDIEAVIGSFEVVDILSNTTTETMMGPQFDVYREQSDYLQHNVYFEAGGVEGDDWGPQGGWIIDKYKFVPLIEHAGKNWPDAKWYIYMEDDTYLFLPNVLKYLSTFDWKKPHWLGSYAAKSDIVFAQGGAGFALSRGAWEHSFGQNPQMARDYEQYAADHCCGDQILGYVLNEYGVHFGENGGDETFRYGFNPKVHWNFAFEKWSWCDPLYSWHKVHSRDVALYYELEKNWDFTVRCRLCLSE